MSKLIEPTVLGLAVALCVGLAPTRADWPTWQHDAARSGSTEDSVDPHRVALSWIWRAPSPPQTAWPGPAKWDAYAQLSGLVWMRDYDAAFHPIIYHNRVYFGSSADDALRCVRLTDGVTLWSFTTDGPIRNAPTAAAGRIYFGSDDGYAYCIDANTGELVWKFSPTPSLDSQWIVHQGRMISRYPCRTGVLVDGDTAFCGFALLPWNSAFLCAVDAERGIPTSSQHFVRKSDGDSWEGPLLRHGSYIVAPRGRIEPSIVDAGSGQPGAKLTGGGGSWLAVDRQGRLWHGPGNKTGWLSVSALDKGTRFKQLSGMTGAAFGRERTVVFGNDQVVALNQEGEPAWRKTLVGVTCASLSSHWAWLGAENQLVAIRLADGEIAWEAPVEGTVRSVAIHQGCIVAATDRGHLYSFQEKPLPPSRAAIPRDRNANGLTKAQRLPSSATVSPRDLAPHKSVPDDQASPDHEWAFVAGMDAFAKRRGIEDPQQHVPDRRGEWHGRIKGRRHLWQGAGIQAIQLDGATQVELAVPIPALPSQALTAEAWVTVDSQMEWGGIFGCIRDNGSDEQGWSLGFRGQQFSFAVRGKSGVDELTYLTAPEPLQFGQWYHVVGTYDGRRQKLYVNGKCVAESSEQRGAVQYPPSGWVTIGSYRDENEEYCMKGKIERVALYDACLTEDVIRDRFQSRVGEFPRLMTLELGPLVRFPTPAKAELYFRTTDAVVTRVHVRRGEQVEQLSDSRAARDHRFELDDLAPRETVEYTISYEDQGRLLSSTTQRIENEFNYRRESLDRSALSDESLAWSSAVVDAAGRGGKLWVVLGPMPAERIHSLVTDHARVVRQCLLDEAAVERQRRALRRRPGYGLRFSARHVPREQWRRVPQGAVNTLVVDSSVPLSDDDLPALAKWLQPGGVLVIPSNHAVPQHLGTGSELIIGDEEYFVWKRPRVEGAGEWTHLYARPDNSSYSGESLQGASSPSELRAQWLGRPGPSAQADRSGRKPSPLAVAGRLFVQGLNRIAALDAYNGMILWELEVADWARFNMPRDCSNWCADDAELFLAVRDRCYVIDQTDGHLVRSFPVWRPSEESMAEGRVRFDWGYVARAGDALLGTAVRGDAPFREFWGKGGWYDARSGPQTSKVCADALFALDAQTGERKWRYGDGVIVHSSITVHQRRVYFVESRDPEVRASPIRRCNGPRFWSSVQLACLDLDSGELLWRRDLKLPPAEVALFVAAGKNRIILVTSASGQSTVQALSAADGSRAWNARVGWPGGMAGDHGRALSRPVIVDERVFVRPAVFLLASGERLPLTVPYGKCGTFACAQNMFLFRNATVSAWSPTDGQLSGWARLRPDCWLSTLPALGMVLSPEAGGGCSCGYWYEASLGFAPKSGFPFSWPH